MRKLFYIVLDGLGDLPTPEIGGKTPLEFADTPSMDDLAKRGKTGLMYSVAKDIAPQSDVAVISILGYDPDEYYTGRGPLESYAEGLVVNDGDLALRVNFATGEGSNIIDRRVGRDLSTEEAKELAQAINAEVKLNSVPATFEFKSTIGHRGVLVIRSEEGKLCGEIENVDPAYYRKGKLGVAKEKFDDIVQESKPVKRYENNPEAQNAAKLVNEFVKKSHDVLDNHPINKKRAAEGKLKGNLILARDAGDCLPKFPSFKERFGINFATFVEMPVERGIAKLMDIEIVELPQPSGDLAADYQLRAKMALDEIKNYDGLYIHIKGPDEPAHDGKVKEKIESIELIDKNFFEPLLTDLDLKQAIIAVTADHSTPCIKKSHSDDPVPLLIAGGDVKPDNTTNFSEKECAKDSLGLIEKGTELMPKLLSLL
ncbi:MAG: alkaline phosphatase family protein [Candidatus Poribacteria bacterium]